MKEEMGRRKRKLQVPHRVSTIEVTQNPPLVPQRESTRAKGVVLGSLETTSPPTKDQPIENSEDTPLVPQEESNSENKLPQP